MLRKKKKENLLQPLQMQHFEIDPRVAMEMCRL
jgi:hypothetical protein